MWFSITCKLLQHHKPFIQEFLVFKGYFMYLPPIAYFKDVHFPSFHFLSRTDMDVKERVFVVVLPSVKAGVKESDETLLPACLF